jgi:single-strand DNA-binding protein
MAGSVNQVTILGNVGKDPEVRSLQNGGKLANLTVATEESWKDKASGEKKSQTEWHRVVIFNPGLVGVVEQYVKKGSKIYLQGKLQTRKWTDQSGTERYSTEVVIPQFGGSLVLLTKQDGGGSQQREERQPDRKSEQQQTYGGGGDLDDDIPFGPEWR